MIDKIVTTVYKMETNVSKNNNTKKVKTKASQAAMRDVVGEISPADKTEFEKFFSFNGMIKAFLLQFDTYTRRQFNYAIESGNMKLGMLEDIKAFIDDNKERVAAFTREQLDENQD